MKRSRYVTKTVRVGISLLSVILLGSVFPKVLPGWLAYISGGWLRPLRWPFPTLLNEGMTAVLLAVGYLHDARSCVESECECVRAEHRAFLEFAEQIQRLSVPPAATAGTAPLRVDTTSTEEHLQTIQDAYRETIMAVPHYEDEYDEELRENMAAELSPEIATAVVEGQQYSPQLQQMLVTQARLAADHRATLLEILDAEENSVATAQQRLREAKSLLEQTTEAALYQHSFSDLQTQEKALHTRLETCDQLLTKRQEELQQNARKLSWSKPHFCQYLYSPLEVTFPVLNATLERIQKLRAHRQNVIKALTRRI